MPPTPLHDETGNSPPRRPWIRFDRHELSGAFGDVGTDLPLLLAMIPAAGLEAAGVFLLFGVAQIAAGLAYGLPMPMQPLKAMAVIVIAEKITGGVLFGGGLAVGAVMLALTATGLLDWLVRVIPRCAVRGIQLGLALKLGQLALRDHVPAMGAFGYALAAGCFALLVLLRNDRRIPPALPVIGVGLLVAAWTGLDGAAPVAAGLGWSLPSLAVPSWADVATGFVVLALPQLPLSISNSVIATHRTLGDLFPERRVGVGKIGLTYSLANLTLPLFGGVPVCHGCGGLAGHYALGGRTGGSALIIGGLFVVIGLLGGGAAATIVQLFPLPVLGVILLFEAIALGALTRDVAGSKRDLSIALLVALCALALPQGFLVGMLLGCALYYTPAAFRGGR